MADFESLLTKLGFKADLHPLAAVNEHLEGIQRRLEFLAAAEMVKGIYELTERFSHFAEQLGSSAMSAGLTTDALQKLQFAGELNAVSSEDMTGSLAHLSRQLQAARDGSKEATGAFAKAGITPAQIKGFRTSSDALLTLSDRFQNIQDPIKKQAILMQLAGRSSYRLVGLMNK